MVIAAIITFGLAFLVGITAFVYALVVVFKKVTHVPRAVRLLYQLSFALHTLALICLLVLLITEDYTLAYVQSVVNPVLSLVLKITALWGGQAGSLFFWGWILSAVLSLTVSRDKKVHPLQLVVMGVVGLFFTSISLTLENPFMRLWSSPVADIVAAVFQPQGAHLYTEGIGVGLNPLLRHPGMIIHPPVLYIGYAAFLFPFGEALTRLVRSNLSPMLSPQARRWTLFAWIFLTAGIALGSWWSYDVLGWGGYWGWDPVEVASLLPWLAATALLHSLRVENQRGHFRRFVYVLTLLTYLLVLFSIFITRTGLISSVHAFGQSKMGLPFGILLIVFTISSIFLLSLRWKSLGSGWEFKSFFSRDAFFLYTNLVLIALLTICLWGLVYPLLTSAMGGRQVVLDAAFYARSTKPLFIALVFVMAVCPLFAWGAKFKKKFRNKLFISLGVSLAVMLVAFILRISQLSTLLIFGLIAAGVFMLVITMVQTLQDKPVKEWVGLLWRMRRRLGAVIVHLSILIIALGITGMESLAVTREGMLVPGERLVLGKYAIELQTLQAEVQSPEVMRSSADLTLYRNSEALTTLTPAQDTYINRNQYVTIPDVYSAINGDLYVLLLGYDTSMGYVAISMAFHPFVKALWVGAWMLVIGTSLSFSASYKPEPDLDPELDRA